jgi:hypothetical protein
MRTHGAFADASSFSGHDDEESLRRQAAEVAMDVLRGQRPKPFFTPLF